MAKQQAALTAYREDSDWYFLPFVRNECGETQFPHVPDFTPAGRAEENLPELTLATQPDLPVEVFDVTVTKAGDSPCSRQRKVTFKIKNVSGKTISGFGFRIEDMKQKGAVSVGVGLQSDLKAGEITTYDGETFTAYRPHILRFDFVRFVNGKFWHPRTAKRGNRNR